MLSSRLKNVIRNMPDVKQCDVFVTNLCEISSGLSSWWWHFWRMRMVPVLDLSCCTDCAMGLSVFCRSPSRRMPEWYIEIGHDRFIRICRLRKRFSRYGAAKLYLNPMSFCFFPHKFGVLKELRHFKPDLIFATRDPLTSVWYYRLVKWNCK